MPLPNPSFRIALFAALSLVTIPLGGCSDDGPGAPASDPAAAATPPPAGSRRRRAPVPPTAPSPRGWSCSKSAWAGREAEDLAAELLRKLAESYEQAGRESDRLTALEQLAQLSPAAS